MPQEVREDGVRIEQHNAVGGGGEIHPHVQHHDLDRKQSAQDQQGTPFVPVRDKRAAAHPSPGANRQRADEHSPEAAPERRERLQPELQSNHITAPKHSSSQSNQRRAPTDRLEAHCEGLVAGVDRRF